MLPGGNEKRPFACMCMCVLMVELEKDFAKLVK
jgi:hypothetical protein